MIILIPLVSPKTSAGLQAGKNKEGINNPIWIWGNKKINKTGSTLRVEFGSWRPPPQKIEYVRCGKRVNMKRRKHQFYLMLEVNPRPL